jgi:hypothetical protein
LELARTAEELAVITAVEHLGSREIAVVIYGMAVMAGGAGGAVLLA